MAQRLRSCAAPAEEPDLITSSHLRWFTTTNSTNSRGSDILFQPLQESTFMCTYPPMKTERLSWFLSTSRSIHLVEHILNPIREPLFTTKVCVPLLILQGYCAILVIDIVWRPLQKTTANQNAGALFK